MTDINSTVLKKDTNAPVSYSDFVCNYAHELFHVKAMITGARSIIYESELQLPNNPELLDAAYLLENATEQIKKLTAIVSNTEFSYQVKTEV